MTLAKIVTFCLKAILLIILPHGSSTNTLHDWILLQFSWKHHHFLSRVHKTQQHLHCRLSRSIFNALANTEASQCLFENVTLGVHLCCMQDQQIDLEVHTSCQKSVSMQTCGCPSKVNNIRVKMGGQTKKNLHWLAWKFETSQGECKLLHVNMLLHACKYWAKIVISWCQLKPWV